jgi:hypothetical protein
MWVQHRIRATCYMPIISRGSVIILRSGVNINISRGLRDDMDYRAVGSYGREARNITDWNEKMAMDRSYPQEGG